MTFLHDGLTIKWENEGKLYCLHVQRDDDASSPREDDVPLTTMACWHGRHSLGDEISGTVEEFWQRMVRENVPDEEITAAVETGKLTGIRMAANQENGDMVDIYETYSLTTVLGASEPTEELEYEGISRDAVSSCILDDLTVKHCHTLLAPFAVWLPLWLYDHSGITMSCGTRTYPYNDPWDSGQVGWIIVFKDKVIAECGATEKDWEQQALSVLRSDVAIYDQYLTGQVYGFTLYEAEKPDEDLDDDGVSCPDWQDIESCWGFYGDSLEESDMLDTVGNGLAEAIEKDAVTVGDAERHVSAYYTF